MSNSSVYKRWLVVFVVIILISNIIVDAGLYPETPGADAVLKPGDVVKITWQENGKPPALSTFQSLKVEFMTGADLDQTSLAVLGNVSVSTTELEWTVPTVAPAGKIYFLRYTAESGKTSNQYFATRFIITDLQGNYPPPPNPPPPAGKNQGGQGKIISSTSQSGSATNSSSSSAPSSAPSSSPSSNNSTAVITVSTTSASVTPHPSSAAVRLSIASELFIGFATLFAVMAMLLFT